MGDFTKLLREYLVDLDNYTTEQSIAHRFLVFLSERPLVKPQLGLLRIFILSWKNMFRIEPSQ